MSVVLIHNAKRPAAGRQPGVGRLKSFSKGTVYCTMRYTAGLHCKGPVLFQAAHSTP